MSKRKPYLVSNPSGIYLLYGQATGYNTVKSDDWSFYIGMSKDIPSRVGVHRHQSWGPVTSIVLQETTGESEIENHLAVLETRYIAAARHLNLPLANHIVGPNWHTRDALAHQIRRLRQALELLKCMDTAKAA